MQGWITGCRLGVLKYGRNGVLGCKSDSLQVVIKKTIKRRDL